MGETDAAGGAANEGVNDFAVGLNVNALALGLSLGLDVAAAVVVAAAAVVSALSSFVVSPSFSRLSLSLDLTSVFAAPGFSPAASGSTIFFSAEVGNGVVVEALPSEGVATSAFLDVEAEVVVAAAAVAVVEPATGVGGFGSTFSANPFFAAACA